MKDRMTFGKAIKKYKFLYLMLVPVVIWYLIFCYAPMYGVVTAFQDYNMNKGVWGSPFAGLKHFQTMAGDKYFWQAFRNTIILAVYRLIIEFPIPILMALFFNEIRAGKFKKTVQTVVYLPHFLSWVIAASIVTALLSPGTGLLSAVCDMLGADSPVLLTDPKAFRPILILSNIWKEAGWNTIIYVATISGIEQGLYEASQVDGANRWQRMWHITLPGIRSVVVVMLILSVGQILNAGFDQIYNLYNARVYETGDIIDTYIFRTALGDNKLSYASAVGLLKSVLGTALLILTNSAANKINDEGIF